MRPKAAQRNELTAQSFWRERYLGHLAVPLRPSDDVPSERCLMAAFERLAPAMPRERLFEIGCAPGRWMVFYAERFGAAVAGIEYTELGVWQTRENLLKCGISGDVVHADFWSYSPAEPYDIVLSIGFIEHFREFDAAFRRHASLIRPGGRLVLAVPNFQGLNRTLARWCDRSWLDAHNMDAMGVGAYMRKAVEAGLEVQAAEYVGGFDPDIISVRVRGKSLLAPAWRLRRRRIGDHLNGWWLSSHLLMVFSK
jgi:2-polyprenyl-3-methyl-5-hydroxy-6-metoxy-1,4-benzoquinol methylase